MKKPFACKWTGCAVASVLAWVGSAQAQQITIGVSAPLSGGSAILGEQVLRGADVAAKVVGAQIVVQDDLCSVEGGELAARKFLESKVVAVLGYLCTESLEAALPILQDAGVPAITVGVRTNSLTDKRAKTGWPIFRLAPRDDGESTAVSGIIPKLWRDTPFAIIDDGTIQHRDLAESLRLAAEEAGVKPVLVDGFRPALESQTTMVKRLKDAGANAVFISGDSTDIAVFAKDAAKAKFELAIAGGETLASTTGSSSGTIMIGLPVWRDVADPTALKALDAASALPDGYVLPAYAAVQIIADAAKGETAQPLAQRIQALTTQTAIGSVRFDDKGDLTPSPYRAFTFDGSHLVPMETE